MSPLSLCDGTEATTSLDYCDGTGFTWKFIDHSGTLRRANDETVLATDTTGFCDPNNKRIGGRVKDNTIITYNFNPALGAFLVANQPGWPDSRHSVALDVNGDGVIDSSDIAYYEAQFLNPATGQWSTDFGQYQTGDIFRFFVDQNGNFCPDSGEPRSLSIQRGLNQQKLLWDPARNALNEVNGWIAGTDNDFQFASLWFPEPIMAPGDFGGPGPGQGNRAGHNLLDSSH